MSDGKRPVRNVTPAVDLVIFLFLILVSLGFRLPHFFVDVIHFDESIFLLIGRSLLEGNLPYVQVWETKPPLGFLYFAFFEWIMPESLAFVRLCGAVLVALAAFLVFRISLAVMPRALALLSAVLFIAAISRLIGFGQAVMMEHLALAPLLAALLLLMRPSVSRATCFAVGILLAVAAFTRPNLVVVAICVVAMMPFLSNNHAFSSRIVPPAWAVVGGFTVLCLVTLPYVVTGNLDIYIRTVFIVPLYYSYSEFGWAHTIIGLVESAVVSFDENYIQLDRDILKLIIWPIGIVGLIGLAISLSKKVGWSENWYIIVFAVATALSILLTRHAHANYLIQIAPFIVVGFGFAGSWIRSWTATMIAAALAIVLIIASLPTASSYMSMIERYSRGSGMYIGPKFQVFRYLESVQKPGDTLFVARDVILYWLTGTYPVLPIAGFPPTLTKEAGILKPLLGHDTTTGSTIAEIFCQAPTRVILTEREEQGEGLARFPELRENMIRDYLREAVIAERSIYRRKSDAPAEESCGGG